MFVRISLLVLALAICGLSAQDECPIESINGIKVIFDNSTKSCSIDIKTDSADLFIRRNYLSPINVISSFKIETSVWPLNFDISDLIVDSLWITIKTTIPNLQMSSSDFYGFSSVSSLFIYLDFTADSQMLVGGYVSFKPSFDFKMKNEAFSSFRNTLKTITFKTNIENFDFSKQISALTENMEMYSLLETIDFSGNHMNDVTIPYFSRGIKLDLSRNNINKLQIVKVDNKNMLASLDLSWNKLVNFEMNSLTGFDMLKDFKLSNNMINQLVLPDLMALETLSLDSNNLQSLKFGSMYNLKSLNISNNKLSFIDCSMFAKLDKLIFLDLSFNSIQNLCLTGLVSIQQLLLNNNQIKLIGPQEMSEFGNLIYMDLSYNLLEQMSFMSPTIKVLSLKHNNFQKVPNLFLRSLTNMDLSYNQLESIRCFSFFEMSHISHLDLSNNKLSSFCLTDLELLKRLKLNSNKISVIDRDSFGNMTDFTFLNLDYNALSLVDCAAFDYINPNFFLSLLNNNLVEYSCNVPENVIF